MKFIRRSDLEPQTRIDLVKLAWQGQGIYGKMTHLAREYHISRTFLSQMTWAAHHQ
jgi:hypothetical protein